MNTPPRALGKKLTLARLVAEATPDTDRVEVIVSESTVLGATFYVHVVGGCMPGGEDSLRFTNLRDAVKCASDIVADTLMWL